jgi:tellurium resistance protein TerD
MLNCFNCRDTNTTIWEENEMAVNLQKGGNSNISREAPGIQKMTVGLGWDARATDGVDFDLDAIAFILDRSGKVRNDSDMIFYNNKISRDGFLEHTGDNLTGAGDGDDETIIVQLNKIPEEVEKISFCVTIHEATTRRQNFGQVSNAFIRILDNATNIEIVRFDLSEDFSTETALIFGEIYRNSGDWKFKAIGQGYNSGLASLAGSFGVNA